MTDHADKALQRATQVDAVFGGNSVQFRLERGAHWADVIATWLDSPLALYHRVLASAWTPQDVAAVLSLAYVGAPGRALGYVPEVDQAITASGAGSYTVLVLRILEGHLFGLDPVNASFNEREAFTRVTA